MYLSYLIAFIPICIGGYLWATASSKFHWAEWLVGSLVAFLVAFLFNVIAVMGMTSDVETWSGQIDRATFSPAWVEEYEEPVYKTVTKTRTNSDSKTETYTEQEFSHYEKRYRNHPDEWYYNDNLGSWDWISREFFQEIRHNFKSYVKEDGGKSGFYSGDPNKYVVYNKTGFIYPLTTLKSFENRIKAAPSLFSYVPVEKHIKVFDYPANSDKFKSDRLLGEAKSLIPILEWDKLNARLGPTKHVNLILVGFPEDTNIEMGHYQEAKWIGGKKNDLVICYGGGNNSRWTYVFGWTESELVKKNLETLFLDKNVDFLGLLDVQYLDKILGKIENEIKINFEPKKWSKFDYIKVTPPLWSYWILIGVMTLSIGSFYIFAYQSDAIANFTSNMIYEIEKLLK